MTTRRGVSRRRRRRTRTEGRSRRPRSRLPCPSSLRFWRRFRAAIPRPPSHPRAALGGRAAFRARARLPCRGPAHRRAPAGTRYRCCRKSPWGRGQGTRRPAAAPDLRAGREAGGRMRGGPGGVALLAAFTARRVCGRRLEGLACLRSLPKLHFPLAGRRSPAGQEACRLQASAGGWTRAALGLLRRATRSPPRLLSSHPPRARRSARA